MCASARSNAAAACSRRPRAASVRPRARASFAIADGRPRSRGQRLVRPQEGVGVLGPAGAHERLGVEVLPRPEARLVDRRVGAQRGDRLERRQHGLGVAARAGHERERDADRHAPVHGVPRLGRRPRRVGVRGRPVAAGGGDADHGPPHERGVGVLRLRHERERLLGGDDGVRPVAGGELRAGEDGEVHRADEQRAEPQLARGRRLEVGAAVFEVVLGEAQPAAHAEQVQVVVVAVAGPRLLQHAVGLVRTAEPPQAQRQDRRPPDRQGVVRRERERPPVPGHDVLVAQAPEAVVGDAMGDHRRPAAGPSRRRSAPTPSRTAASPRRSGPSSDASCPTMLKRRAPSAKPATSSANARACAASPAASIQSTARSSRSSRSARVGLRRDAATMPVAADSRHWPAALLSASACSRRASSASGPAAAAARWRSEAPSSSTSSAARACSCARRAGPIWS